MATGKIKWISKNTGVGIIDPDSGGEVIQIAISGKLLKRLEEGTRVEYDFYNGAKEIRAVNIRIIAA